MKRFIFTLIACVATLTVKAQIGYNYDQYDFGLSAGFNTPHSDFEKSNKGYAAHAHFTYNATPFLNYIAELQVGGLSASSLESVLPGTGLSYNNDYTTVAFRAQLQMGEIMDYSQSRFTNFFKNIYISSGVGVFYSNLKVYQDGELGVESKGSNLFIPAKVGYEFKIFNSYNEPWAKLDIGYQINYILSDNMDGFTYGGNKDNFTQIVVGLKIGIGGTTSYRKSITY